MVKRVANKTCATPQKKRRTRSAAKGAEVDHNGGSQNLPEKEIQSELNAYERILAKVTENCKQRGRSPPIKEVSLNKSMKSNPKKTKAIFREDDNFVEMLVENVQKEFPTSSEEENNREEDGLSDNQDNWTEQTGRNNNATLDKSSSERIAQAEMMRMERSTSTQAEQLPGIIDEGPSTSTGYRGPVTNQPNQQNEDRMMKQMSLMQNFMIKKGIITDEELQSLLDESMTDEAELQANRQVPETLARAVEKPKKPKEKSQHRSEGKGESVNGQGSTSEVTIYKRAVRQIAPQIEDQITDFISEIRGQDVQDTSEPSRKVSSSSEELMDTSDESPNNFQSFVAHRQPNFDDQDQEMEVEKSVEEMTRERILDAEKNKPVMYEVPGKSNIVLSDNTLAMDNDYQMIDAHVDETMRKRILSFEFIDFLKLLAKNRTREEDQRLEIVNRNGMTFLSPVSERETTQINSYVRWELAFRVYSSVFAKHYPNKATELLQYNHTIHTASLSYIWDNVYNYDKEFRHHISRYLNRVWNVILQQAWTMILKDRLRVDHSGNDKNNKRDREPCHRFNKGKCNFGLACRFDHRCSVPKCGKFGQGAHICRLRNSSNQGQDSQTRTASSDKRN